MKTLLLITCFMLSFLLEAQNITRKNVQLNDYKKGGSLTIETNGIDAANFAWYKIEGNELGYTMSIIADSYNKTSIQNLPVGWYALRGTMYKGNTLINLDNEYIIEIDVPNSCQLSELNIYADSFLINSQPPMKMFGLSTNLNSPTPGKVEFFYAAADTLSPLGLMYEQNSNRSFIPYTPGVFAIFTDAFDSTKCKKIAGFMPFSSTELKDNNIIVFPNSGNGSQAIKTKLIRECSGNYVTINGDDYKICNTTAIFNLVNNDSIEITYSFVDLCSNVDTLNYCQLYHKTNGKIYLFDAKKISQTAVLRDIKNTNFLIYPNPTQNVIHLKGEFTSEYFKISDIHGKTILGGNCIENSKIDVKEKMAPGIYFMTIYNNYQHEIYATKLIVE